MARTSGDMTVRTRSSATVKKRGTDAKDRLSLRKDMFDIRVQLAVESYVSQSNQLKEIRDEDTVSLTGTSSLNQQSPNGDRLVNLLRSVMKKETTSQQASCRVAYENFRLGKEYVGYVKSKEDDLPEVHSQSFHRVALPHLALVTKALTKFTLTQYALRNNWIELEKCGCSPISSVKRYSLPKQWQNLLSGHCLLHNFW
jgi:hypothetical protein